MSGTTSEVWYVYMTLCSDGSIYTGITNDPSRRMRMHNAGKGAKYTRTRRPVKQIRIWTCWDGRREAAHIEAKIKKLSHKEKEKLANHKRELPCSAEAKP